VRTGRREANTREGIATHTLSLTPSLSRSLSHSFSISLSLSLYRTHISLLHARSLKCTHQSRTPTPIHNPNYSLTHHTLETYPIGEIATHIAQDEVYTLVEAVGEILVMCGPVARTVEQRYGRCLNGGHFLECGLTSVRGVGNAERDRKNQTHRYESNRHVHTQLQIVEETEETERHPNGERCL
jgi:hypothetical protein